MNKLAKRHRIAFSFLFGIPTFFFSMYHLYIFLPPGILDIRKTPDNSKLFLTQHGNFLNNSVSIYVRYSNGESGHFLMEFEDVIWLKGHLEIIDENRVQVHGTISPYKIINYKSKNTNPNIFHFHQSKGIEQTVKDLEMNIFPKRRYGHYIFDIAISLTLMLTIFTMLFPIYIFWFILRTWNYYRGLLDKEYKLNWWDARKIFLYSNFNIKKIPPADELSVIPAMHYKPILEWIDKLNQLDLKTRKEC